MASSKSKAEEKAPIIDIEHLIARMSSLETELSTERATQMTAESKFKALENIVDGKKLQTKSEPLDNENKFLSILKSEGESFDSAKKPNSTSKFPIIVRDSDSDSSLSGEDSDDEQYMSRRRGNIRNEGIKML